MLRYRATYGSELQMDGIVTVFPSIAFICHPLNGCNPVVSGTFGRSRHPQHDPASRRQDGGWRGRVGVPVAAPHTLAATGDLRPPRIRRAGIFVQTGACSLWLCTAALARGAPGRSRALPRTEDGGRVGRAPVFHSSVDPRRGPPRFSAVTDPERPCAGFVRRYVQFSCRLPGAEFPGRGVTLSGPF